MNNNYPPVIVIGLNNCSLSLIRSLGRRGIKIIGLYDNIYEQYFLKSKYCSLKIRISSIHNESLINFLTNGLAAKLNETAVLFCATDTSVLIVSKHEKQLRPFFKFVLPPYGVSNSLISKKNLYEFSLKNSFIVPLTFFTNSYQEVMKIKEDISYPCIIKPEYRDRLWNDKVPEHKALYATSKEELVNLIKRFGIEDTSLVIQEWIDGDDSNLFFCMAYLNRIQQPLAICTGRKLRQYPFRTGTLSVGETIWLPEIADEAVRFLRTSGCVGFGAVECKKSRKDGRFYIIEPTVGRPEAIAGIFMSAGLDVPFIAYLDAIGKGLEGEAYSTKKIKWINEPLEFECIRNYRAYGKLWDFMSAYKGSRYYSLLAYDDPLPAFTFFTEKILRGINKVIKRIFKKPKTEN